MPSSTRHSFHLPNLLSPSQILLQIIILSWLSTFASAGITVHYQQQKNLGASATTTGDAASYTGAAAYNPLVLTAPPVPNPPAPQQFFIQLQTGGTPGVSIPQSGSFFGFSIEMSVTNQVFGKNSSHIQVPFLNLMANLVKRSGRVMIRVGGNTQESATLVDSNPDGKMLEKDYSGLTNPTQTPPIKYTDDLLYLMRNISNLLNIRWFLGIPFFDTTNWKLDIVDHGQKILGDYLLGFQAGNEPDLYFRHQHRPEGYGPFNYFGEIGDLINVLDSRGLNDAATKLLGPSLAYADWTPEQVWDTGFIDAYANNVKYLTMEKYPTDNCNFGTVRQPQDAFFEFLNHTSGQNIVRPYLNSTSIASSKGKPLLMFETNTASCGGFPGISDSFGAALWGLDYALQMAYANFSGAMFHIGGQNVYYNPFTPPPTNQSTFRQWTVGPLYYSALVMAEALGSSNQSQVLDLNANAGNIYTPAYAIYEGGNPVRLALFNYVTDGSGASSYTATFAVGGSGIGQGNASPGQVKVKYLQANSVNQKSNFTWAGQTFGDHFASDGRPMGTEDIKTVQCDTGANTCAVQVPAPGMALVFLSDDALKTSTNGAPETTYSTTAATKTINTATIDPSVLATSNGHSGMDAVALGSTSKGSISGTGRTVSVSWIGLVSSLMIGGWVVGRRIVR